MQSKAATVEEYLASLPPDRRDALQAVRKVILANLDKDYEEGMGYGMMGYYVPHRVYPPGYHCDPKQPLPFAGLASQKNHMSVYLMSVYGPDSDEAWLRHAWAATGKKLDMGKSCIRFKRIDDLPLHIIGEAIRRMPAAKWIAHYESHFKQASKASRTGGNSTGSKASGARTKGAAKPASNATAKKTAKKTAKQSTKKAATPARRAKTARVTPSPGSKGRT